MSCIEEISFLVQTCTPRTLYPAVAARLQQLEYVHVKYVQVVLCFVTALLIPGNKNFKSPTARKHLIGIQSLNLHVNARLEELGTRDGIIALLVIAGVIVL